MGNFLSVILLPLAAILQASLIPQFFPDGGGPNLVFLVVLSWSFNATFLGQSIIWALLGGILLDLFSVAPVGISSVPMVMIVFFSSGVGLQLYRFGLLWLIALTTVTTLVQEISVLLLIDLSEALGFIPSTRGFSPTLIEDFSTVVLPTLFYNLIWIIPVYVIVRRIQRRVQRRDD